MSLADMTDAEIYRHFADMLTRGASGLKKKGQLTAIQQMTLHGAADAWREVADELEAKDGEDSET